MKKYKVEVTGDVTEIYKIDADGVEDARAKGCELFESKFINVMDMFSSVEEYSPEERRMEEGISLNDEVFKKFSIGTHIRYGDTAGVIVHMGKKGMAIESSCGNIYTFMYTDNLLVKMEILPEERWIIWDTYSNRPFWIEGMYVFDSKEDAEYTINSGISKGILDGFKASNITPIKVEIPDK